ncbi:DinB family protein [Guptibacillus algicola]|uniref:DinB family protein n=1 Tax=Guptibacillus algicola TaxID=225844 RepID=UPI001CD29497|nr:DinB family protein [Alkalihalobacillus algicola]MCA0985682.1 DinB family protein [Alkalihalobacillus algicola]
MLSMIILDQFNKVRSWSIGEAESLSEDIVNVQPEGFNNTIKWHLGHIITETEYFLFELTRMEVKLPNTYNDFFAPGTKPATWQGESPLLSELVSSLKIQAERVHLLSEEKLVHKLDKPKHGFNTAADSVSFSVLHESLHLGQLISMKQMIKYTSK